MKKSILFMLIFIIGLAFESINAQKPAYGYYRISPVKAEGWNIDNTNNEVRSFNGIKLWDDNGERAQIWNIYEFKDGVVIASANNTNFILAPADYNNVAGGDVVLKQLNGVKAQIWIPERIRDNVYIFRNAYNPSQALAIAKNHEGDKYSGRNVELAPYDRNDMNIMWKLTQTDPLATFENDKDGKLILSPHSYMYESPKEKHYISFYPDDPENQCTTGILYKYGEYPDTIYDEDATYTFDGNTLVITTHDRQRWTCTLRDGGKTLVVYKGNKQHEYKAVK